MIARFDNKLITDFFPFPKYRQFQKQTLEKIQSLIQNNVKDIILEMPTGSGKSPVAISAGLWSNNAYCLTSQKILQDQYIRDFEDSNEVSVMKGRSNYECSFLGAPAKCNECYEPARKECYKNGMCLYQNAKKRTMSAVIALMNYSYFLNVTECDPNESFKPRKLLICDECLPGSALIWTNDNELVKIEEIYRNENITHVMSFNEQKNIYEKKKILRRFRNEVTEKDIWYKITVKIDGKIATLKLTSNHKVWTKNRGYVIAEELTLNDIIKFDVADKFEKHYCKDCSRSFSNPHSLKIHSAWHKNKNERIKNIKKARHRILNDSNKRKQYSERISGSLKNHNSNCSCILCHKEFKTNNAFSLHYFMKHNNGGQKQWDNLSINDRKNRINKIKEALQNTQMSVENRKKLSDRMKKNNPSFNLDVIEKMKQSLRKTFNEKSEKEKQKIRQNWINAPKKAKGKVWTPTIFERKIIDLQIPDLAYTGDGKFWLNIGTKNNKPWNKNPDFKVRRQRKVIEVGDIHYWHTLDEIKKTIEAYKSKNFDCLYLTNDDFNDELWDQTKNKIHKFIYNHDVKILKIEKCKKFNGKINKDKEKYRYNIEVEDNHNYFANNILVSNCHQIESELMGQIEFLLSEYMFKRVGYPVSVPTYEELSDYQRWIKENVTNLASLLCDKADELKKLNQYRINLSKGSKEFEKLAGEAQELTEQTEELDRLVRRMNVFLNTLNTVEWIFTVEKTEKLKMKRVVFRPLTVDLFAADSLLKFGEHRIYLSATILDHKSFCKSLGINHEEAEFIRVPSTFPKENRRIYFTNSGYMNMANLDETLPKVVNDVTKALNYHKEEKGLIHCHSYKIANHIENNCDSSRLLFHTSENREEILQKFIKSSKPLVLVSPSMTEGLDLKGDLARWEIIVKIPYLYIGDKQVARRMQVDPDWYNWQTCLTLVQSYGRIFRSEDDWGTAYVFDSGARGFIRKNRSILPDWFIEACMF